MPEFNEISQAVHSYDGVLKPLLPLPDPEWIMEYIQFLRKPVDNKERAEQTLHILSRLPHHEYVRDYFGIVSQAIIQNHFPLHDPDRLNGLTGGWVPPVVVAEALWEKQRIFEAFNHPMRIYMRQILEQRLREGYNPISSLKRSFRYPELQHVCALEEFGLEIPNGEKVSRSLSLALGNFVFTGRRTVGLPFGSETMHTVIGNPIALADIVRCHGRACAPRNGQFSDPRVQAKLIENTWNELLLTPLLIGNKIHDTIVMQWMSNLGMLVEADPKKAVERVKTVVTRLSKMYTAMPLGIGYIRIYQPEGSDETLETARVLMEEFGLPVNVSFVVSEEQALQADELGVNAIGLGVGSGSRCSTATRTGTITQNANLLAKLTNVLKNTAVFVESGVPIHAIPIALAFGARCVNQTRNMIGFLSTNAGMFSLDTEDGRHLHPVDGEASAEAKLLENRVWNWRRPSFVEGAEGFIEFDKRAPTIAHRMWEFAETLALMCSFQRCIFVEDFYHVAPLGLRYISQAMQQQVHPFEIGNK